MPETVKNKLSSVKIILWLEFAFSLGAIGFLFWLIYFNPSKGGEGFKSLPALNATLNTLSAGCLVIAYRMIKAKRVRAHQAWITGALLFSALFLISYIIYHHFHGDTPFLGEGWVRPFYFFILISHIVLSILALPLVLYTYTMGLTGRIMQHKRVAKVTFSLWLYVSVTGVLIFALLKLFS